MNSIEKKIRDLENKQNNKENVSNLLNIIKNNFFEKKELKEISNDSLLQKISRHNKTINKKGKHDKFENDTQKFYGKICLNKETDYPDDTKEVIEELQGNIEDFKDSLKNQLKNLQKKNEMGNVEEIANEINLYKKNYKKHIEDRNNQNLKEISILVEKLNEFKDESENTQNTRNRTKRKSKIS